jgi:HEAT repeat protein
LPNTVALGNAGDPQSLPLLSTLSDSDDLRLRTRAVEALRFIDDPSIDPLLEKLLTQTAQPPVQLAALRALRFRDIGPLSLKLAELAQKDPTVAVRKTAIELLGSHSSELPALRSVLLDISTADADATNRAIALGYLTQRTRPEPLTPAAASGGTRAK